MHCTVATNHGCSSVQHDCPLQPNMNRSPARAAVRNDSCVASVLASAAAWKVRTITRQYRQAAAPAKGREGGEDFRSRYGYKPVV